MPRSFRTLRDALPWRPIRGCPGRLCLPPESRGPGELAGGVATVHRSAGARDPVWLVALDDGGLLSYQQPDGRFLHTLASAEGWTRKLRQLGLTPPTGGPTGAPP